MLMPMISAAMSWSANRDEGAPTRVRMRFIVPTMGQGDEHEQEVVHVRWVSSTIVPRRGRATSIEACTPPLMNVNVVDGHSMMS